MVRVSLSQIRSNYIFDILVRVDRPVGIEILFFVEVFEFCKHGNEINSMSLIFLLLTAKLFPLFKKSREKENRIIE